MKRKTKTSKLYYIICRYSPETNTMEYNVGPNSSHYTQNIMFATLSETSKHASERFTKCINNEKKIRIRKLNQKSNNQKLYKPIYFIAKVFLKNDNNIMKFIFTKPNKYIFLAKL